MIGRLNQIVELLMVIVVECDEPEWLINHIGPATHRFEHFGHALHVARLGLECDLDEVAFGERLGYLQQAPSSRDGLQLGFRALAVAKGQHSLCGCELNTSGAMEGIDLGVVCHAANTIAPPRAVSEITEANGRIRQPLLANSCLAQAGRLLPRADA